MPQQIYIGNFAKGLTTNPLPFNIDNDAFPTMFNFYSWRGRAKRKRGTIFLGQLERQLQISETPNNFQVLAFALVAGAGNLITQFTLGTTASITPGSINLIVGGETYTDPDQDGILVGSVVGSGTINYATGDFTIVGGAASTVTGTFAYFPGLPVMGLRSFVSIILSSQFPLLLAFDTTYAYQINQSVSPPFFYNVAFYKGTNTPFIWSGQDFQLFWTTNYSGALWATNNVPGFHFVQATATAGSGTTTITFHLTKDGPDFTTLIVGDKLWFNEFGASTVNGFTGTITNAAGSATGVYIVTFDVAHTAVGSGIAQLLTASITGQDGIKWYDGDPTSGTGIPTGTGLGWVNFAPPLTATSVAIDNKPSDLYYLVGALTIIAYKDRLLFFNAVIQTSTGNPIRLQDTVIWSWNGTPYYADPVPSGETSNVTAYYIDQTGKGGYISAGVSQPIITVSTNEDVLLVGFGGNIGKQTRLVYTGDDLFPFAFFLINNEMGSSSTFSAISLDRGVLTIGSHGIAMTTQQSTQRIDLPIPDSVFQIQALNNGVLRVNSERDFFKEWVYFAYPLNNSNIRFPTQTFLYNYRDMTWAILYENFTAHGTYRAQNKNTWVSIGQKFKTWAQWRETWASGSTAPQFPSIVGGNPQGYVLIKGQGTGEGASGTIQAIAASGGFTQITSIDHCVQIGDYLLIQGVLGLLAATITAIALGATTILTATNTFTAGDFVTISGVVGTTELNNNTYKILAATGTTITLDVDSTDFTAYISGGLATSAINGLIGRVVSIVSTSAFVIDLIPPLFTTVYLGNGKFVRLSQPLIQTKQFPVYWEEGRQVRLSTQKYLMDATDSGQVTVFIFLSQDPDTEWNVGSIVPMTLPDPSNNSLVYSQTLFTCPESTNIGLTKANSNLQMPTAASQFQIWHRFNTSLIGDSFQIGITLSDLQMRVLDFATSEITLHGMHLTCDKGPHLA